MDIKDFWKVKSMEDFTEAEWESVCLKCGKCCVLKSFENGWALFSNRVCDGLDMYTGKCSRYETRLCADCAKVDINLVRDLPELLPETCAYRMLFEGKGLPQYHPLITKDDESVKKAKQRVLDWPNVHSSKDIRNELMSLSEKSLKESWSLDKLDEEENKLFKRYPVVFVAKYPIPEKTQLPNQMIIDLKFEKSDTDI